MGESQQAARAPSTTRRYALAAVLVLAGFVAGIFAVLAYDQFLARRAGAWEAQRAAVDRFYAETPGFSEYAEVLRPLIDGQQDLAVESLRRPPRTQREQEAYLTVVALFLVAETDHSGLPPGAVDVLQRALKRRGLNSYWIDPDPRFREAPGALPPTPGG